ncbi:MAG TPA: hypothetical protein DEG17_14875 [Cyanobacteria bacterium UBA11149]|nr:hypothetical protein [Cyanobacteria bacterium UBA11367]HBE57783.1 hypothetical protein [Cyanobacteria bacterium UBA11366]HBK62997.1 hypothetical protein [Cyanobacteria bacterium UBA11166]HBR77246.1 hypothetical protein [Cyanobacteria bacterium UBA11159]HBS69359.1 hypothetical protein [Cyanobacteria bacterium UBA11153]HBW90120.1 hypothetical protein [Cyanobacteria bacterium UBA11149]HCA97867.1 hypothetical protein [Cyanobacteria bacterium UBA9226]
MGIFFNAKGAKVFFVNSAGGLRRDKKCDCSFVVNYIFCFLLMPLLRTEKKKILTPYIHILTTFIHSIAVFTNSLK